MIDGKNFKTHTKRIVNHGVCVIYFYGFLYLIKCYLSSYTTINYHSNFASVVHSQFFKTLRLIDGLVCEEDRLDPSIFCQMGLQVIPNRYSSYLKLYMNTSDQELAWSIHSKIAGKGQVETRDSGIDTNHLFRRQSRRLWSRLWGYS